MGIIFEDRLHAGEELAEKLEQYLQSISQGIDKGDQGKKITNSKQREPKQEDSTPEYRVSHQSAFYPFPMIVLAIPRGGIILGNVIATHLHCNLDIIVSRKIGAEYNKEAAIGAVMPDGSYFLNEHIFRLFNISKSYIEREIEIQKKEIERRLLEFRGSVDYNNKLKGRVVILVDDGIATGATIIAASQWIRRKHECKKLIVAVPVAPIKSETVETLNQIADKVIILHTPDEFYAVGQFYKKFDQTTDQEVKAIMTRYGYTL